MTVHVQFQYEKEEDSGTNIRMLQLQWETTIHVSINKFRKTGLLLDKKEPNQNTKHSMMRNWVKPAFGLYIPFKNTLRCLAYETRVLKIQV
jgi:hypothetical protein